MQLRYSLFVLYQVTKKKMETKHFLLNFHRRAIVNQNQLSPTKKVVEKSSSYFTLSNKNLFFWRSAYSKSVFPKQCAAAHWCAEEDLQVCRGVPRVLSKCFLLLQIFCQNRENAGIAGHGERSNDLFLKISTIWGCITRFAEVVAQKSGDLQKIKRRLLPFSLSPVMLLNINWNRFQGWCAAKFVQVISCPGRQKSLGNTVLNHNEISFSAI